MAQPARQTPSAAIRRVRALRERSARELSGQCYVEGIRHVLAALEGGHAVATVLLDPAALRSDVGWEAVARAQAGGAEIVEMKHADFQRISSRDNPVGLAAIVNWQPLLLDVLRPDESALMLAVDDVHDPGNLGTLVRAADGAGCQAVIVHGGVDPAHPTALRASLGTMFRIPVHQAASVDVLFTWADEHGVTLVATTAHASEPIWDIVAPRPVAVLVGNEGAGLPADVVARCDIRAKIPMLGTATSLNVSVAAGIVLYELARRVGPGGQ